MSHDFNDNELSFDTRNRIINETLRLIKENPETGPTLTEICGAVGVSKRTFYYYFRSINDVICELSHMIDASVIKTLRDTKRPHNSVIDDIMNIIYAIAGGMNNYGNSVASSHYTLLISNQSRILTFESLPGWRSLIALITRGKESGELVSDQSPEDITKCIYYILRGICMTWGIYGGNFDYSTECLKQVDAYLKLLQPKNA